MKRLFELIVCLAIVAVMVVIAERRYARPTIPEVPDNLARSMDSLRAEVGPHTYRGQVLPQQSPQPQH
ncbi:MAG TPA: hypothetical protein VK797_22740 [Tepidisphaeraceae bacterium]|jgi:hypothetical protein|nr:hypothetical protein [Tepidisphaeraceae bacterium]